MAAVSTVQVANDYVREIKAGVGCGPGAGDDTCSCSNLGPCRDVLDGTLLLNNAQAINAGLKYQVVDSVNILDLVGTEDLALPNLVCVRSGGIRISSKRVNLTNAFANLR